MKQLNYFVILLVTLIAMRCSDSPWSTPEATQVKDTINRLFVETDNKNWSAVREVFAEKVSFDMTSLGAPEVQELTPGEITAMWADGLKHVQSLHHQVGNYRITVDGDQAAVFCYGIAMHYLPNPTGKNTRTFVGSYDFRLIRTDGNWRIDDFRFNLKFIDGNVNLEKSAGVD